MADDVRRPPGDSAPTPPSSATRARNRTIVMGAESMGHMRAQLQPEEPAQIPEYASGDAFHSSHIDAHDPLGLESSGHHDDVSEDKTLQALDEIFDIGAIEHAAVPTEPDVHEGEFGEPDMEAFDAHEPDHRALTEIIQPAPISVARIVRPGAGSVTQAPPAPPAATEVAVPPAPAPVKREEHKVTGGVPMSEQQEEIFWKVEGPLVGFLVSYDHDPRGTYVELRTGRLIVSSQREDSGNCLVIRDATVSPMHAIMRVAPGGIVQVLDQLSESGTRVKHIGQHEEVFLSGEKATVAHGDVVFFGERKFHVVLVLGDGE